MPTNGREPNPEEKQIILEKKKEEQGYINKQITPKTNNYRAAPLPSNGDHKHHHFFVGGKGEAPSK